MLKVRESLEINTYLIFFCISLEWMSKQIDGKMHFFSAHRAEGNIFGVVSQNLGSPITYALLLCGRHTNHPSH